MKMNNLNFNLETMKQLEKQDAYIRFLVRDLRRRGHLYTDALEIAFNSAVLDDGFMGEAYKDIQTQGRDK